MKNKIELKKFIITSIFIILIWSIICIIFNIYQYKTYTDNFNDKIEGIITKITDKYPEVSKAEIIEILNNQEATNSSMLKEYGIDLEKDSIVLENEKYFHIFIKLNTVIIALFSLSLLCAFLKYNKSKDKKLKEITQYIEEINRKNYKLDIEDNTEDELSILKNEIYKVTIMLKEVAENSKQDKVNLKNSLSDISHQLKTPLTSITILIDNIIENPEMDNETRLEFARDIKREITNINFLVQSLLKLSKLDANSVKFINEDVKLEEIIQESIKNVSILCDLKGVNINIKGDSNSRLYCDLKWQVEAITNILKNAIEHSKDNGTIDINYEQNKIYSKIEIMDYGVGIHEDDIPHIFERFYKGKNSSNESVGIGLALAKKIIENNKGYISVESALGKETKFTIKYFE